MKKSYQFFVLNALCALLFFSSCSRSKDQVWDDTKSCKRYVQRGLSSLGGKQGDSKAVSCREEFFAQPGANAAGEDFIPFCDIADNGSAGGDFVARQPRESPGDPGSAVPGIEAFFDPSAHPHLAPIFQNLHFAYDSSLIKGQANLERLATIAAYLRKHPHTYMFVEGHCDERGAEAYNLALGAQRANTIRNALIRAGVNPDVVFTISYGKERPLALGHNNEAWELNRRAEFKIYHR